MAGPIFNSEYGVLPVEILDWVRELFLSIDARDPDAFTTFQTADATFRYGSQPAVSGQEAIRPHVAGFFAGLAGLSREIQGFWWGEPGRTCFVQGQVTYRLPGGAQVSLPFANILHMRDDKVGEYLIYADPNPLYGPA
jgi:ketosteroid isomerase-like protein